MFLDDEQRPLYEIKANLFKGLANPARIRALEILCTAESGTASVAELLEQMDIESSHLSQHLRVLRRHRVVTSERRASHVYYSLAHPGISELLDIARVFLNDRMNAGQR